MCETRKTNKKRSVYFVSASGTSGMFGVNRSPDIEAI